MSMKLKSRLARVVTAATIALGSLFSLPTGFSVSAEEGKCGSDARWSLSNGTLTISGSGTISSSSWSNYSSKITSLVVSEGITNLPTSVFKDNTTLKSVKLGSTVTNISISAFDGCTALESVSLPDSLTEIRSYVFKSCTSLKQITLPSQLQTIASSAFSGCLNLQSIDIPSSVTSIGEKAFYATGLQKVELHTGLKTIGKQAFYMTCFPIVTIPSTVTEIGSEAFGRYYNSIFKNNGVFYGDSTGNPKYVTIYGKEGSAAEQYAKSAGLTFHAGEYIEHTCSGKWVTEKLSTCVTPGRHYFICTVCGEKHYEDMPLGDHTMGDWKVTKAPTCTASGIETCSCIYCNHTETREVSATGHSLGEWKVTKAPTCTEDGIESRKCEHCDKTETRTVSATGHSLGEWKVTKAPTCTEDGIESRKCEHCDKTESRTLSATGHNWSGWSAVKAPTFTETGIDHRICETCGYEETREVPVVQSYVIRASCSSGGTISPSGDLVIGIDGTMTYNFAPNKGYEISDVKVDNVSIGKISTYTFYSVTASHSIHVEYEKIPVVDCCSNVIITPKKAYWDPTETKFDMNDFTITAKIVSGDTVNMVDITKDCRAKETPKSLLEKGYYGVVKLGFTYSGRNSAVQTYLKTNEIADVVTLAYKGDGNLNGEINADDACMALREYVDSLVNAESVLTEAQYSILNIISSNRIDADDATAILQYYVNSLIGVPSWDV